MTASELTFFLAGDVMTGRGVDQILPNPGDSRLWESYVHDARAYVDLAQAVNGAIPVPVAPAWPWGEALDMLDDVAPEARVVNLETSVTTSGAYESGKGIHYRMHPANVACLTAARLDACTLANNHVLDFGASGLQETIDTLRRAGIRPVGAGPDLPAAQRPVALPVAGPGRVVIFSVGVPSSGVPAHWAAAPDRPGVDLLPDLSPRSLSGLVGRVRAAKRPGDVVVVSVHWGSNWGYDVPRDQVRFARGLIDGGVDVVFGHSSHHPRPVEVYHGRLVLYGCGDLINDYEGIGGYEAFRDDLRLLYFPTLDRQTGALVRLRMAAMRSRRMRLEPAAADDRRWLADQLDRISHKRGARVTLEPDGLLVIP